MQDTGIQFSNEAVAVIFGAGGFLVALFTSHLGRSKGRKMSSEELSMMHDGQEKRLTDHDLKFSIHEERIRTLELNRREDRQILEHTRDSVKRVEKDVKTMLGIMLKNNQAGE